MSVIDPQSSALQALGYEGSCADMTLAWLRSDPAVSANRLRNAWSEWLSARGYAEGIYEERWFYYLGAEGYKGNLGDREKQFWEALAYQGIAA